MVCVCDRGEGKKKENDVLPDRIQNGKKSALIRVLKHIECSSKKSVVVFIVCEFNSK